MELIRDGSSSPYYGKTDEQGREEAEMDDGTWEPPRRTYAEYKQANPQGDLCQRCAGIDWPRLLSHDAVSCCETKSFVTVFPTIPVRREEFAISSCSLCQLLAFEESFDGDVCLYLDLYCSCMVDPPYYNENERYNNPVRHSLALNLTSYNWDHNYVSKQHYFSLRQPLDAVSDSLVRKLDAGVIDYEILRHNLALCRHQHDTTCGRTHNSPIPGLRVIDCNTGKVIAAPEDSAFRYTALSYVWGNTQTSEKDDSEFPATIRDAITVTLEMGIGYLWVDQYCINQLDKRHKQTQIQLMGRIYAESELVIIAAAGISSSYGLPGVGTTARKSPRTYQLDTGVEAIEFFTPHDALRGNTWGRKGWVTRGWTHQEGFLAKRRFVFTDEEVLCVCNRQTWQESVQRATFSRNPCYRPIDDSAFPNYESGQSVYQVLTDYSARTLSFESDILHACTGILNELVDCHYWGLPVWKHPNELHPLLSLKWKSLRWATRPPSRRRKGFPTWSWAAVTGPKEISPPEIRGELGYVMQMRATDGSWLYLDQQIESRYEPLPVDYGPTLRLIGKFYTATLAPAQPNGSRAIIFESSDSDGNDIEIALMFYSDTKLEDPDMEIPIKAVPITIDYTCQPVEDFRPPEFMILQSVGDHYRRIGITDYCLWVKDKRTGQILSTDRWDYTDEFKIAFPICTGDEEIIDVE